MYEKNIAHMRNHWGHAVEPGKIQLFYLYRDSPELYEIEPGKWNRRETGHLVEIECDTVILCTTRVPNNGLFRELKARKGEWAAKRGAGGLPDWRLPRAAPMPERDLRRPPAGPGIRRAAPAIPAALHPRATNLGSRDLSQAGRRPSRGGGRSLGARASRGCRFGLTVPRACGRRASGRSDSRASGRAPCSADRR